MNAEQLARLGNLRSALELLFAECDVNVASHPTFFVDRIDEWSAWDLPGALYGATRLREQVFEAYRLARVEVPDAVLRLFVAPEPRVGSASFPVVLLDGRAHVGTLRTIAMALSSRSLATIGDPAFTDAVESARRHVLVRCTGAVKQRIRDAQWTILPALESNAALADGSVALAAFVAFLSLALERAVAPAWVFSGVLRDGVFAAPAASTFDEKLRAIGSRTFVRTVFCPRAAGSMASDDRVDEEANVERIAARVFDEPWDELAARLAPRRRAPWVTLSLGAVVAGGGLWMIRPTTERESTPTTTAPRVGDNAPVAPALASVADTEPVRDAEPVQDARVIVEPVDVATASSARDASIPARRSASAARPASTTASRSRDPLDERFAETRACCAAVRALVRRYEGTTRANVFNTGTLCAPQIYTQFSVADFKQGVAINLGCRALGPSGELEPVSHCTPEPVPKECR